MLVQDSVTILVELLGEKHLAYTVWVGVNGVNNHNIENSIFLFLDKIYSVFNY